MNNMNLGRTEFNYSFIPVLREEDPFWLLGFIEAGGTFGFKNLSPFFSTFALDDLQARDRTT